MAMVMLFTFGLADQIAVREEVMNNLAAGALVLPFVLFSSLAGQLADKYAKSVTIRYVKLAEIILMVLGAIGFYFGNLWALIIILFLMGSQSTFFGPLKYAMLPELLREDELITGNAYIEGATFVAIILGLLVAGLLIMAPGGLWWTTGLTIGCAVAGWLFSLKIPQTNSAAPKLEIDLHFVRATTDMVRSARANRPVFASILAIGWFWLFGALFMAQFPAYTKNQLGADEGVVTLFLGVFSIGVGVGSMICALLLKGKISARFSPPTAIAMALLTIDLYFASQSLVNPDAGLMTVQKFLLIDGSWRIIADMALIAIVGGIYIVPFYAILQDSSADEERSRMVAVNNIVSSGFMVLAAGFSIAMIMSGFNIPDVLLVAGLCNFLVAGLVWKFLPDKEPAEKQYENL